MTSNNPPETSGIQIAETATSNSLEVVTELYTRNLSQDGQVSFFRLYGGKLKETLNIETYTTDGFLYMAYFYDVVDSEVVAELRGREFVDGAQVITIDGDRSGRIGMGRHLLSEIPWIAVALTEYPFVTNSVSASFNFDPDAQSPTTKLMFEEAIALTEQDESAA